MSWIKRNLYFLIGGVVAAALLGLAGWYCYFNWQLNDANHEELKKAYDNWNRISTLNPNPGNEQVDNIQLAREHQQQVRSVIRKTSQQFIPIPPIPNPDSGAVTKDEFSRALRSTITQLQKDAANNSVNLAQPNYGFSFKTQLPVFNFSPGSLGPLSVQLGEVRAICGILFRAKVNSLDSVQRERVAASPDDLIGPPADYLQPTLMSVTNELAVLTPYVIQFRCFSAELAGVLAGFGNSSQGLIVKTINVEPGSGTGAALTGDMITGGGIGGPGGERMPPHPFGFPAPAAVPAAATPKGGLPVVLDEKPLKVTIVVTVVKLLPKK